MADTTVEVGVGLAEAIATVRAELERATEEGHGRAIGFDPGPLELEFQIGFQISKAGAGSVRVWVATVDAKADTLRSGTHRLKLTLTPVRRSGLGNDKLIRDQGVR